MHWPAWALLGLGAALAVNAAIPQTYGPDQPKPQVNPRGWDGGPVHDPTEFKPVLNWLVCVCLTLLFLLGDFAIGKGRELLALRENH